LLHLASALSRLALRARHPLPLRGRGKEQRAAPRQPSPSIRPRITPAVHQQILPGDESRMRRAEKREVSPELLRPPITLRRIARRALAPDLVERLAAVVQHALDVPALAARVEDTRQQIVDGDIVRD